MKQLNETMASSLLDTLYNASNENRDIMNRLFKAVLKHGFSFKNLTDSAVIELSPKSAFKFGGTEGDKYLKIWLYKDNQIAFCTWANTMFDDNFNWNAKARKAAEKRDNSKIIGVKSFIDAYLKSNSAIDSLSSVYMIPWDNMGSYKKLKQEEIDKLKMDKSGGIEAFEKEAEEFVEKNKLTYKTIEPLKAINHYADIFDGTVGCIFYQRGWFRQLNSNAKPNSKYGTLDYSYRALIFDKDKQKVILGELQKTHDGSMALTSIGSKHDDCCIIAKSLDDFLNKKWLTIKQQDAFVNDCKEAQKIQRQNDKAETQKQSDEALKILAPYESKAKEIQAKNAKITEKIIDEIIKVKPRTYSEVYDIWRSHLREYEKNVEDIPSTVNGMICNSAGFYYASEYKNGVYRHDKQLGAPGISTSMRNISNGDEFKIKLFNDWVKKGYPTISTGDRWFLMPGVVILNNGGRIGIYSSGISCPAGKSWNFSTNNGKNINGTISLIFQKLVLAIDCPPCAIYTFK